MVLTGCKNCELQYQHAKQDMSIGGMIIINMKITNHVLIGFVVHYTKEIDASEQEKHATIDTVTNCAYLCLYLYIYATLKVGQRSIFLQWAKS